MSLALAVQQLRARSLQAYCQLACLFAVLLTVATHKWHPAPPLQAADSLLQHFNPYNLSSHEPLHPAPCFEGMQASPHDIRRHSNPDSLSSGSPTATGSPYYNIGFGGRYDGKSNSGVTSTRTSIGSVGSADDGMCEIALVAKKGPGVSSHLEGDQVTKAKLKDRDGIL